MISKLTKKQEAKIDVYLQKWLKLGRRTRTTNVVKAKEAINFFYGLMGMEAPKDIRFVASPLQANKLIHELKGKSKSEPIEFENFTRSILWIGYYGYYDYVLNELFPSKKKDFKLFTSFLKHSKELFGFYLFENVAIVSDFPKSIKVNNEGSLHSDKGASMEFRDGFALYNLNGIAVSKEVATIKPTAITKDLIVKEENADIRREIIRKLTAEQLVNTLDATVMDTKRVTIKGKKITYELLNISLNGDRVRPFLKMNNPSIEAVHVEGVSPECKTVDEALKFRNGVQGLPQDLS